MFFIILLDWHIYIYNIQIYYFQLQVFIYFWKYYIKFNWYVYLCVPRCRRINTQERERERESKMFNCFVKLKRLREEERMKGKWFGNEGKKKLNEKWLIGILWKAIVFLRNCIENAVEIAAALSRSRENRTKARPVIIRLPNYGIKYIKKQLIRRQNSLVIFVQLPTLKPL